MRDDNDRRFATAMQTIRWQALGAKKENETKKTQKRKGEKRKKEPRDKERELAQRNGRNEGK